MKATKRNNRYNVSLLLLNCVLLLPMLTNAQEKLKARVAIQYINVMDTSRVVQISAKYKTDNGFEKASGVEFTVYRTDSEDSLVYLGKSSTNDAGEAKYTLEAEDLKRANVSDPITLTVKLENSSKFQDTENAITFSEAALRAEIVSVDSSYQIKATLADQAGNPVKGVPLSAGLQRMYGTLPIGEESYETDDNGSVLIPITERMPGVAGNLLYEVTLNESDEYGTIRALVSAPIGIAISDQSTFDHRTMWSPSAKVPLFLVITAVTIILAVWIPLIRLAVNLFRISKSSRWEKTSF